MATVPPLRVPAAHRRPFRLIAELDDETFGGVLAAITGPVNATPSRSALVHAVQDAGVDEPIAEAFIDALLSMRTAIAANQWAEDDVALSISHSTDLELDDKARDSLHSRLSESLGAAPLRIAAKALDVRTAQERILVSARVLTDVRPIFADDAVGAPIATVINEVLRIEYYQDNEIKTFHVALDDNDISTLQETLKRAIQKSESVKTVLDGAGIPYIEAEDD